MKYLVLDDGSFCEASSALSDKGKNEVNYKTVWEKSYASFLDWVPGLGFDGLKKIKHYAEIAKDMDCIVCFDVNQNDDLVLLKQMFPKKSFFGAGLGEELESNRWGMKKLLKRMGLDVMPSWRCKGVDALRKVLSENVEDAFVKIDIFKKDFESFHAERNEETEQRLDRIEADFDVFKNERTFIVEKTIKAPCEAGCDLIFNGNDFVKPYIYGYELSKVGYVGCVSETLPAPLKATMDKFVPELRRLDYRGMISTEEKVVSEKEHYVLDICSRGALPLSIGYTEWIKNWPEVVYKVGLKQPVRLSIPHKYVAAFPLSSAENKDKYLKIHLKAKDRNRVKFWFPCKKGEDYYSIAGSEFAVVLLGWGNSVDEAIDSCIKSADLVDFEGKECNFEKLTGIKKQIDVGKKVGIPFK